MPDLLAARRRRVCELGSNSAVGWRKARNNLLRAAVPRLKDGDYAQGVRLLWVDLRVDPKDAQTCYDFGIALSYLRRRYEALVHLLFAAEQETGVAAIPVDSRGGLESKGVGR